MKMLSLDLSTSSSGWAVYEDKELVAHGTITASSTDVIKRIYKMRDNLRQIIMEHNIDKIVAEEVLPTGRMPNVYKALSKLQAAMEFMLHDEFPHIKKEYILPNQWRSKLGIKTGRGKSREGLKMADMAWVKDKFDLVLNDDESDAIAIGYSTFVNK